MKSVIQLIRQFMSHKLGAFGVIVLITAWVGSLNPGSALAEFAQTPFDQGVFSSISPIDTPTPTPPLPQRIVLAFEGPSQVAPGQTFNVAVSAQGVTDPGLYGVQLEIDYDPTLFAVSNLQINPDLSVVIINSADNTSGKIRIAGARHGYVPGLTGDVPLLTFTATAANTSGSATFTITQQRIGNPQALILEATTQDYTVSIQDTSTPEPTETPPATPTNEPSPTATNTPTPLPTETPVPTDTPTPGPTQTPTPEPTVEPNTATVLGQIILTGRINNDWSGASATFADSGQSATTDTIGHFSLANVSTGLHSAITADAPGYLPAVCTAPTITAPETTLANIVLLSGDVNDDGQVNITDATTIGVYFGQTEPDLPADLNRDQQVDILDLILVTINFGQGPQVWSCLAQ